MFKTLSAALVSSLVLASASARSQSIEKRISKLEQQVATLQTDLATLAATVQPLVLPVNCGAGESVTGALAKASDRAALVSIDITGFCQEDVTVSRPNTILTGKSAGAGFRFLTIAGAQRVSLSQITLGRGLRATRGSSFLASSLSVNAATSTAVQIQTGATGILSSPSLHGCGNGPCIDVGLGGSLVVSSGVIEGNGLTDSVGVNVSGGAVQLTDTSLRGYKYWGLSVGTGGAVGVSGGTLRDNQAGLAVTMQGNATVDEVLLENNSWLGIVMDGGDVIVSNSVIRQNGLTFPGGGAGGIRARSAGRLFVQNTTIEDNGHNGIEARDLSQVLLNRTTIQRNQGDGIILGSLSFLESSNAPNTVSGNGGFGLSCVPSARYRDYSAFVMSGNTKGNLAPGCTPE
jgi:hypothetical protein